MRGEVGERLYSAPPEGFIAARDEAVAEAKASGDVDAAREIAKLRKPTVAAWLVNLLAIRRPDLMGELVELSRALRAAQRDLQGPQLRELSAQRRQAVAGLVDEARKLGLAADPSLTRAKLPLSEVENTLTAALSDEDVAAQVRSGRLVRAAAYAGFGEVPRPQLRLVTAEEAVPERPAPRAEDRRGPLKRELTAARTAQKQAETDLEKAATAERRGADALARVEAELAEVERRRAAAEEELSRRKVARKAAERAVATARRHTGEVEGALEALDRDRTGKAQSGG
ncbi:hypothetical protein GCM10022251_08400 [Phytohabitans flavus]|uniref:Uncharacterized protein n=1 Tax=Phytohabitans flavus TaxID=1076124 RepID=A0A6F8Y1J4_9ACTN|nr:hypothetical protein [Phytohabitans flavus]BCB79976.1 hypothetical protein Pflav_063860 [Phytohabitans flavus]